MSKSDKGSELPLAAYYIKLEELVREYLSNGHLFNCTIWHPDLDGNKICCCGYDALVKHIEDKP